MSFKCGITGKTSKLGEKVNRIVVSKREKNYYEMRLNEDTGEYENTLVGRGWEIEKEIFATKEGLELWEKTQAALKD